MNLNSKISLELSIIRKNHLLPALLYRGSGGKTSRRKWGEEMLDCNYQLKNTFLEKEKGNSIISKIMESLKGLNVTTAEFLLEECKKEIYQTAKI